MTKQTAGTEEDTTLQFPMMLFGSSFCSLAFYYSVPNYPILRSKLKSHNFSQPQSVGPTEGTRTTALCGAEFWSRCDDENITVRRPTTYAGRHTDRGTGTNRPGRPRTAGVVGGQLGAGHVTATMSIPPTDSPHTAARLLPAAAASPTTARPPPRPGSNLSSADRQEIGFYRSLIDR